MSNPILRASRLMAIVVVGAGCSGAPAVQDAESAQVQGAAPGEPTLAAVRAATERFRDVKVALAEGYIQDPSGMCATAEMEGRPAEEGAMGIHYFRPDLLGITGPPNPRVSGTGTYTDFRRPGVLIYEPQSDGSLELVAVENLVFIRPWERAGNRQPPSFHGVPFDRMEDDPATELDEAHMFEPHYDRHVWLYRENPNGVFAQYNPNVSCKHHGRTRRTATEREVGLDQVEKATTPRFWTGG
ncbi:MAG: hypothetical protein KY464_15015 [Gemmatimonadetes bacterium]|nr:hypothetical protein [Gemmatimonadota bacterium]